MKLSKLGTVSKLGTSIFRFAASLIVLLLSVVEPEPPGAGAAQSRHRPEPPFLAGAVKKGAAPAPALQLKL